MEIFYDIASESFAIGENILEERFVKKILRSLLPRFAYKAIIIREAKDIKNMRLEELMGPFKRLK